MNRRSKCVVLMSGGLDSTACASYYMDLGFEVKGLFIDYGQLAAKSERNSVSRIARHYGITLDQVSFVSPTNFGIGEIRGRNAFFIMTALLTYPTLRGILSLGIHSGVSYYDCSEAFLKDVQTVVDGYTSGEVMLNLPFLKWDKSQIWTYCTGKNVPVDLTYSCQAGTDPPCGGCPSCKDREALNAN